MNLIEPWLPFPILDHEKSKPGKRQKGDIMRALALLQVSTNPRYTPRDLNKDGKQDTFCNILTWDFCRAMGLETPPHWVSPEGGVAPVGKGRELSANGQVEWLHDHGYDWGWTPCAEVEARAKATYEEQPVLAVWNHHGGIGHVAVVVPGVDYTHIAQAGARNFVDEPLSHGFGRIKPEFWWHD